MTNPMFNPQPNYSGVTIQIANPAVNVGDCARSCVYGTNVPQASFVQPAIGINGVPNRQIQGYNTGYQVGALPQNNYVSYPQGSYPMPVTNEAANELQGISPTDTLNGQQNAVGQYGVTNPSQGYPNAYPAQYYLNNYNYGVNGNGNGIKDQLPNQGNKDFSSYEKNNLVNSGYGITDSNKLSAADMNSYKEYAENETPEETDFTRSTNIIDDIDERVEEKRKEKKNTKEKKIIALTDEYIKSLENYLNNPNDEIRLMASKEVLKRLDEDKDRYNDAALNALLNKMMQDPSKLVRLASLSAFASQLASGNDYTVKLLHDIQANPNADKEDVLQAADILLKMSADVEVKNVPIPPEKKDEKNKKNIIKG